MPDNIEWVIRDHGGVFVPEDVSTATYAEVYAPMLNQQCMACRAPLGETTMAILTRHGVTMLFCGGQCLSDYNVMGWMSEKYDDIKQQMDFRGGNADG